MTNAMTEYLNAKRELSDAQSIVFFADGPRFGDAEIVASYCGFERFTYGIKMKKLVDCGFRPWACVGGKLTPIYQNYV